MTERSKEKQSQQAIWIVPLVVLAIIVALAVVWRIWHTPKKAAVSIKTDETVLPQRPLIIESNQRASEPIIQARVTIDDVIRIRQHWNPGFTQFVGKQAPDFEFTDINGKTQKLSGYKDKTIMLVFWATWCPPCRMEIPGLIELRKKNSAATLAIIGISYENADEVRNFVSKNDINYTIATASPANVPAPFSMINSIPITFFIDKDGIIRLVTEGLVLPKEDELILEAIAQK
jgi:peroxiredoxin